MKKIIWTFSIILNIFFVGCSSIGGSDEGAIVYEVIFDEQEKSSNPVIGLLPTEMTLYFKDNSSKTMIEGFMGMFITAYISNCETKKNSILFKVMADRHYCQTDFGEASLGFDPFDGLIIEETTESTDIIGLKANKVNVSFENSDIEPFDVYYTKDVKVHNPNWNNPYKEIDGVLLDFRVKMKGITMHLKAKELKKQEISPDIFIIPEGYKEVSPDELNAIVDEIMKSAS